MRKSISSGKFGRVCDMPDTELLLATLVLNRPQLTMWHNGIRVEGEQELQVSLIARHNGFYYFPYKDWRSNEKHYRTNSLPSYIGVITGITLLKNRGGRVEITRPLANTKLFTAKVELL